MTKKLLALVATAVTFSAAPAFAQSRTYWPPGPRRHWRRPGGRMPAARARSPGRSALRRRGPPDTLGENRN